jgi:hypothetical protein
MPYDRKWAWGCHPKLPTEGGLVSFRLKRLQTGSTMLVQGPDLGVPDVERNGCVVHSGHWIFRSGGRSFPIIGDPVWRR